jgi:hypothetical protein
MTEPVYILTEAQIIHIVDLAYWKCAEMLKRYKEVAESRNETERVDTAHYIRNGILDFISDLEQALGDKDACGMIEKFG